MCPQCYPAIALHLHANHLVQTQAPSPGTELIIKNYYKFNEIFLFEVTTALLAFQETHKTSQLSESNLCIKSDGGDWFLHGERRVETVGKNE